jgi:hypothetical protein
MRYIFGAAGVAKERRKAEKTKERFNKQGKALKIQEKCKVKKTSSSIWWKSILYAL